jgi:hypothetical protein
MTVTEDQQLGHPLGVRPVAGSSGLARETINEMLEAGLLDAVMDRVDAGGLRLTGEGGFLPELVKAVLERGLQAELTGHLGYEKGQAGGQRQLAQRQHVQDVGDRGRGRAVGRAAGPGRQLRAAAGAQGRAPRRRPG